MKTLLLLSLVLLVSAVQGQRRTVQKPKPVAPVTIQTATTKDGRTVLLRSDGTWEYTSDPATSDINPVVAVPLFAEPRSGAISIEAALVFRSGDVKPMARMSIYLLDENCASILRGAGLKVPQRYQNIGGDTDENLLFAYGSAWNFPTFEDSRAFNATATEALRTHIKQTIATDFSGKAVFRDLDAGIYYVLGIGKTPHSFAIWSLPVAVTSGNTALLTLDQNNAAFAG
jgi:hypothetical protein